ncbi:MAG: hypothetical protein HIU87_13530 [Acidobacteria bacterium]|nr:hypothetical protein [Acidobacteriota bacterium]
MKSRFYTGLTLCLLCLGIVACGSRPQPATHAAAAPPAPKTKVAPSTPLDKKATELGGITWDKQWDPMIEKALPAEMLSRRVPRDVRRFCPRFYQMTNVDKRAYWAYFFQALAAAEAGLNPTTNVRHDEPAIHKIDSVTGEYIHSEGLLQLTYEDAKRYGCDFNWSADRKLPPHDPQRTILQAKNNLLCGIRILSNQILTQRKPIYSPTSYWSTLQPGTESFRIFEKQMTNPPQACGLHIKAVPARTAQPQPLEASR